MKRRLCLFLLILSGNLSAVSAADEEIVKVKKSTLVNLIDLLVQRGVINQNEGKHLATDAEQEAAALDSPNVAKTVEKQEPAQNAASSKIKHVGYVPEFIKKEIRDQVRTELKQEVVSEVKRDAKTEGWGIPAALPSWIAAIHPSFDLRFRLYDEFYGRDNVAYPDFFYSPFDWLAINRDGRGLDTILNDITKNQQDFVINNKIDRLRLRERFRLGFEAQLADGVKAGIRFATSNQFSPVSNDQTLGNTGQSYQFAIDRAYLQYDYLDDRKTNWFSVYAGRTINPFVSTDVVFDPDLSFEGISGSLRLHFNQGSAKFDGYQPPNPTARFGVNQGLQTPDSVFLTVGAFPIQEINFSSHDKWLYAGQLGTDLLFSGGSRLNLVASYYIFNNVNARKNIIGHENDFTAPQFIQKGNSIVAITDINTGGFGSGICNDVQGCLFGLASEFRVFNATAIFDYAGFDPAHVFLTLDYAKNFGFNAQRILAEFQSGILNYADSKPRTNAYQARIDIGRTEIRRFGDWNINFAYRYIERDAVLDAFTDSVFHNGGTDAKGWVLGSRFGLAKNIWLNLRWLSTDAIDGPTYRVDTLSTDVNARF